jgi:hypothetical protein
MPVKLTWPDKFTARIRGLRSAQSDLGEIMPELERLVRQDNRDGLLAGTDRNGQAFAPLSPQTIKYRRSATGTADPNAPPLVPARERSRAIANYQTTSGRLSDGNWVIIGAWRNVLSPKGVPFLPFHVEGDGHLPVRDLMGVRPFGRLAVGLALQTWLRERWK